ncbi:MAG: hypothetical protein ACK4F7_08905 [Inhella sp.]
MAGTGLVKPAALLGALILGLLLLAWEPDTRQPAGPVQSIWLGPSPLAVGLAEASVATGAGPAEPAATPLLDMLKAPPSQLRASIDRAMRMRESGGRLYARALARRCAELDARANPGPEFDQLRSGCDQVLVSEWLALVNIAADEAGPADPLLQLLERHEAAPAQLAALLARPDPLLLDELGPRLLWQRDGDYYFDGQFYRDDAGRALVEAALRLLPCDLGLPCAADRGAALPDSVDPVALQSLRTRLLDAVQRRAVARFLPA